MRQVMAIAHRGFSTAAPENTLAAFKKAIELHPEMMECDVRRTKDGAMVVIHDAAVDRTTNGKGRVAELTLAEIKGLDAGTWFSPEFAGEQVPTLDELLGLVKSSGVKLIIEIKEESTEDEVIEIVRSREMVDEVIIGSFRHHIGVRMPELARGIPFSPIISIPHRVGEEEAVRLADEAAAVNGSIYAVNYQAVTPPLVRAVHAANMLMEAWTVDDEENVRKMVELGCDAIASNDPDLLLRVLADMGVRGNG